MTKLTSVPLKPGAKVTRNSKGFLMAPQKVPKYFKKTWKKKNRKHPLTNSQDESQKLDCPFSGTNIGVFSKCFHWIRWIQRQKKLKIEKEDYTVGTQDLLHKRQRLYHSATEPQATEQILILNSIHASVISEILWIPWIHWKFCSI